MLSFQGFCNWQKLFKSKHIHLDPRCTHTCPWSCSLVWGFSDSRCTFLLWLKSGSSWGLLLSLARISIPAWMFWRTWAMISKMVDTLKWYNCYNNTFQYSIGKLSFSHPSRTAFSKISACSCYPIDPRRSVCNTWHWEQHWKTIVEFYYFNLILHIQSWLTMPTCSKNSLKTH